ncbi:MAG: carboxymuconolactone decarboxylase family protein [Planctomycetota bacterium]
MTDIPSIDSGLRHLVGMAVNAALGEEKELRRLMTVALQGPVKVAQAHELLLQTALFAGVPRCLNGFRVLDECLAVQGRSQSTRLLEEARATAAKAVIDPWMSGQQLFGKVYGEKASQVRTALARSHPQLESWIIRCAYGEILSRDGLDVATRELLAVAVLTALDLPLQLAGHLRGAIHCGASEGQIRAVLSLVALYTPHTPMAFELLAKMVSGQDDGEVDEV